MRQDIGSVLEVEASSIQTRDPGFELVVQACECLIRAEKSKAGEEDVCGCLDAGGGEGEDVFGGEIGEDGEEGQEGGDEEDV